MEWISDLIMGQANNRYSLQRLLRIHVNICRIYIKAHLISNSFLYFQVWIYFNTVNILYLVCFIEMLFLSRYQAEIPATYRSYYGFLVFFCVIVRWQSLLFQTDSHRYWQTRSVRLLHWRLGSHCSTKQPLNPQRSTFKSTVPAFSDASDCYFTVLLSMSGAAKLWLFT